MQLTRACEYGFQGLIALARHPHGEVVMLEALAADAGVPFSFLGKIFQSLVKSGLVRSVRGSGGGFSFSRDLSQINLLEIVEAID